MAKKLKLWNGRGWGRPCYADGPDKHKYLFPKAASRIYICAHSRAHAARIMAEHLPRCSGFNNEVDAATHELKCYASEERRVSDALVEAWNEYVELPSQHRDDIEEFRHSLHRLQHLLMVRVVRREHAAWTNEDK